MDNEAIAITPRQRQFLLNYAFEGMPAGRAYAKAYNRPVDNTAYVEAHHLLRKPKILAELEVVRLVAIQGAMEMLEEYKKAMDNPELPAMLRFKAAQEILDGKFFRFLSKEIVIRETCPKCAKQDERLREEYKLLAEIKAIREKMGVYDNPK